MDQEKVWGDFEKFFAHKVKRIRSLVLELQAEVEPMGLTVSIVKPKQARQAPESSQTSKGEPKQARRTSRGGSDNARQASQAYWKRMRKLAAKHGVSVSEARKLPEAKK